MNCSDHTSALAHHWPAKMALPDGEMANEYLTPPGGFASTLKHTRFRRIASSKDLDLTGATGGIEKYAENSIGPSKERMR